MIYLTLFLEFFKVGMFCFGGAFGMIPLIEEIVLKHNWLSEEQFYDFIGICESTPGPIAVNTATYIGSVQGGLLGSIIASLGIVLPSFIIILLISSLLKGFTSSMGFKRFMSGVKPVVAGLILSTGVILLIKSSFTDSSLDFISIIIFLLLCLISTVSKKLFRKKLSAIWIIVISGAMGVLFQCVFNL